MKVSLVSCILTALLLLPIHMMAGNISGVAFLAGEPAADVLVSVEERGSSPSHSPGVAYLNHTDRKFSPVVVPIVAGSTVEFRHAQDPACRLYTVSDGEVFRLTHQGGSIKSIQYYRPGVIEVRCQDHPSLHAYIVVKENPYFALTGASGRYELPAVPEGASMIQAWFDGRVVERTSAAIGKQESVVDFRIEPSQQISVSNPQAPPLRAQIPVVEIAQAGEAEPGASSSSASPGDSAAVAPAGEEPEEFVIPKSDEFLNLGVRQNFQKVERYNTAEQINTFIPPLYQPAFVGHGYVLPPGALRIATQFSSINVDSGDFFKGGGADLVHEHHSIDRTRQDIDFFYGLDHNMTVRVNVPFWSSRSVGSVHPAGVKTMDLFVEGSSRAVGDISVMLKKKWVDQGNFYFNVATVTGIKLPNGSNHEKFDSPMVVKAPNDMLGVAFGGGTFKRFTDDGRLPQSLQPGTGDFGYILGFMGTRQFTGSRAALHAGTLLRFLRGSDGVEPGDEVRFFASFVKPVYKEKVSLDFTFNGMNKDKDQYSGTFGHPVPNPDGTLRGFAMTPRPPFRGGTVMFFSPSLIWNPRPQIRLTATASFRVKKPDLGPWPGTIFQVGMTYTLPFYREQRLK